MGDRLGYGDGEFLEEPIRSVTRRKCWQLLRHSTREKRNDFGEEAMRSWWKEKDYIKFIPEDIITKDISLDEAVEMIFAKVNR